MNLQLEGKVALVTGGARGIGAGIVQALKAEGATVLHTARAGTEETIVSDLSDMSEVLRQVWVRTGHRPEILVNNVGGTLDVTDPHAPEPDWRRVVDLNFWLAVRASQACIPHMQRAGWGRIVNITSIAGLENSGPVPYCAAKAALTAYTHSMGRVLAVESPGVVMCGVAPGVIKTAGGYWDTASAEHVEQYLRTRTPTGRFQTMAELAPLVAFYCSEHAAACHGAIIAADQGQSRHYAAHTYL